jgi:hypothetical protein
MNCASCIPVPIAMRSKPTMAPALFTELKRPTEVSDRYSLRFSLVLPLHRSLPFSFFFLLSSCLFLLFPVLFFFLSSFTFLCLLSFSFFFLSLSAFLFFFADEGNYDDDDDDDDDWSDGWLLRRGRRAFDDRRDRSEGHDGVAKTVHQRQRPDGAEFPDLGGMNVPSLKRAAFVRIPKKTNLAVGQDTADNGCEIAQQHEGVVPDRCLVIRPLWNKCEEI